LGHRVPGVAGKAGALPGVGHAQQRQPFAPGPAARAGDAEQRIPGRGQVGQAQAAAIGKAQHQGQAQQGRIDIHAHQAHQAQRFGIGTDQDVLAVVQCECGTVGRRSIQRARPPADGACRLENGDVMARLYGRHGGRHAGPAGADDGDVHGSARVEKMFRRRAAPRRNAAPLGGRAPHAVGNRGGHSLPRACIFQASQNLRSGVRLMRWCSTWKFSCSISRKSVR